MKYQVEHDPPLICVLGRRGSGKTKWTLRYVKELSRKRVLIWDPKHEYKMGAVYVSLSALYRDACKVGDGVFVGVFRPRPVEQTSGEEYEDYQSEEFDIFCQIAFCFKNSTVVIDEMDRFTGPGPRLPFWFKALCNEGRHPRVSMVGVARRPARIPKDYVENCHRLILFHLSGGAVDYLEPTIGKEWAKKMPNLPPLNYIEYSEFDGISQKKL